MIKNYFPELNQEQKVVGRVLLLITFIMLILEYYGIQKSFYILNQKHRFFTLKNDVLFYAQVYTSASFLFFLLLIPWILSKVIGKDFNCATGLGMGESKKHMKSYLFILLFMIPFIFIITCSSSLNSFYPLYNPASLKDLMVFELVYLLQFIGTEFFFRGWPLLILNRLIGKISIFIMVIPYALIHIHKPFTEALASILAGIVLGNLAIKTKSIWPGVLVHMTIAASADLFSLFHSGRLLSLLN